MMVSVLSGCASIPRRQLRNACAILAANDGIFTNWHRALKRSEQRYGIPMSVIMATIYTESHFQNTAKPRGRPVLGLFPGKRLSSAFGYAQALESTWVQYRKATGNHLAIRTNFADSVDFIGWFLSQSVLKDGIGPRDAYHLYLSYYYGHNAYFSMKNRPSAMVRAAALRTQKMAELYENQLRACHRL